MLENIKKTSYRYTRNFKCPIRYYIQTDKITTSIEYKDALEIAYAVIDSLFGSYDYLDDLVEKFEKEQDKGITFESI